MGENQSFKSYLKQLMENSTITGMPQIAQSKNKLRRTFKVAVFLICIVGFTYQTYSFMQIFLEYPTQQDIIMEYPEVIDAPAVTICNKNRLKRQLLCPATTGLCTYYQKKWGTFCDVYHRYCIVPQPKNYVLGIPHHYLIYRLKVLPNKTSNMVLNEFGPQNLKDMIYEYGIVSDSEVTPYNESVMIQLGDGDGFKYRCFTLFSLLGKADEEPITLTLTDRYHIWLNMQPEEYIILNEEVQAFMYIHDPRRLANPIAEGTTLDAGYKYKLHLKMQKTESLPSPYKTNCEDYLGLWKKNGGHGPLTKRECSEVCKINAMMKYHGCVARNITYPNDYEICQNEKIFISREISRRCLKSCREACKSSLYTTTVEKTGKIVLDSEGKPCLDKNSTYCKLKHAIVEISFNRMEVQNFKSEAKFEDVELFSYIGGFLGLWLGISFISFLDFLEMMVDLCTYPILKIKKKKSNIAQVRKI